MPSRVLPGLGLNGFWNLGEGWKDGGDANWLKLSVMVQLTVESTTVALPASPADGVVYVVPVGGGANAGKVAVRDAGAWVYYTPPTGCLAWVKDSSKRFEFVAGAWSEATSGGGSGGGPSPLITETGVNRNVALIDASSYLRFTNNSAKTATFDAAVGFSAPQEFHVANRAATGNLVLLGTGGITLNAPKEGTLTLAPGDTVTVKFVSSTVADVFGSTEVTP